MVTVTLHRKYPCLEPDVPLRHAEVLLLVRMATGRLPPASLAYHANMRIPQYLFDCEQERKVRRNAVFGKTNQSGDNDRQGPISGDRRLDKQGPHFGQRTRDETCGNPDHRR
jgi:hypothetical protein